MLVTLKFFCLFTRLFYPLSLSFINSSLFHFKCSNFFYLTSAMNNFCLPILSSWVNLRAMLSYLSIFLLFLSIYGISLLILLKLLYESTHPFAYWPAFFVGFHSQITTSMFVLTDTQVSLLVDGFVILRAWLLLRAVIFSKIVGLSSYLVFSWAFHLLVYQFIVLFIFTYQLTHVAYPISRSINHF